MKNAISFVVLLAAACGSDSGPKKITDTREVSVKAGEDKVGAAPAERFGNMFGKGPSGGGMGQSGGGAGPMGVPGPAESGDDFEWTTPPGWGEQPPSQFRLINLRPAKNPESDCYFSIASGGVLPNVNRWRKQFGQPELDPAAFAALPKQKLLDVEAVRVEAEGSFSLSMPGAAPVNKSDFKLLGLVADAGGQQFFVKMTGPKALVDQERSAFDAFVASIRKKAGGAQRSEAPFASAPPLDGTSGPNPHAGAGGGFDPSKLKFDVPAGWVKGGDKPMRFATFTPANTKSSECYISIFPGDVGGLTSNVQRWRAQMGLPDLAEAEIPKLQKLTVLGKEATVVDLLGRLNDAMTNRTIESARFLGVICPLDGWTLFVKMTGPEPEVTAAKDSFVTFCQSLRQ